jgi:hypothetical protein
MSKSRAKGTRFERDVADVLADLFPGVDRQVLRGKQDRGDIANVPGWTLECKAEKEIDLAGYMREAELEAKNAKTPYFAAIVKRRNKSVADAYVVMPLWLWLSLAHDPVLRYPLESPRQDVPPHIPAQEAINGGSGAGIRRVVG